MGSLAENSGVRRNLAAQNKPVGTVNRPVSLVAQMNVN
jgi:hypothetical protein